MPKIFISYRRVDTLERTHRIADWLTLKYGERNVFVDVDRLGGGVDFEDVLQASLEAADVLLVIIGNKWIDELNERVEERQKGKDFVYLEVVQGLQKNIDLVIPVVINDTRFPTTDDLPIEMHELTRRQYARVRANPDFHKDMDVIRQLIDQKFWQERWIRGSFFAGTILATFLLIFFIAFSLSNQPESSVTDEQAVQTAVARQLTEIVLPSPTETPNVTQTLDALVTAAIIELTETQAANIALTEAQFTDTPSPTPPPTNTPQPTATNTPNLAQTEAIQATFAVQSANETQAAQAQIATQNAQATELAPTNTPLPTATATSTHTPMPTNTLVPTATATATSSPSPTVDVTATVQAQMQATETQIAVATQIFATAQAQLPVRVGHVFITEMLNIRSEPNTDSDIVDEADPGEVLVILDQTADATWYQVERENGSVGWVSAQFFTELGSYPASTLEQIRQELRFIFNEREWQIIEREFDGVPMVLVPAGCFQFGISDSQEDTMQALDDTTIDVSDEQPTSRICLPRPYWIDKYEVSQSQFEDFGGMAAELPIFEGDDLPRDNVSWNEARAYCELRGGYLPSEVQWEYAARGVASRIFPWGARHNNNAYNWNEIGGDLTTESVEDYPEGASWVGAYQMQGNVTEWTLSGYYGYPAPTRNQIYFADFNDLENTNRPIPVARGSSYLDGLRANARNTNRIPESATRPRDEFGIRCVRDYE